MLASLFVKENRHAGHRAVINIPVISVGLVLDSFSEEIGIRSGYAGRSREQGVATPCPKRAPNVAIAS